MLGKLLGCEYDPIIQTMVEVKMALYQSDWRILKSIISQVRIDESTWFWHAEIDSRNVKGDF